MEIPSTVNSSTRYRPRRKIIYAGIVLRRRRCLRYWLILPLLYILGLLICARPLSLFFFPVLPGSLYRSHEIFQKLRHRILADDSPALQVFSPPPSFDFFILQFFETTLPPRLFLLIIVHSL